MWAVVWSNLTVAAAFVVGLAVGVVVTVRIVKHLTAYFRGDSSGRQR